MQFFVKENFELKEGKCVDFGEMLENMIVHLDLKLEPELIVVIPKILACFGKLEFEIEQVEIVEENKYA